ncbi:ATP-dependent rRNA helicase SPB4 [Cryptococcus gattii E566]|uniref:ATP-dependent RNA helicase n=1 Tax=Cryptococcus gattii serotype B (strain WM276 / ATCC MYA-4071) TaxID=367775 RepID=E6REB9_CRYGW|nr:ATP-dependent rRNA helicase, putative [Cryptococcus gattii WM276]ADV25323.1 ATP-dependent rRNA helicase, putative [Cryptococcus gattii WM276]KIY32077.1 ATP-dependent rRNA helicase SPB4 [Cryptococcus gattii E566]KJE02452.1 ATP-dependent rRNA helicase SPB4 [Cryptococcus gattii NT-10]
MDAPVPAAPAFGGSWAKLNPPLSPWIMDVINTMGFKNMTPVQAGTIPRAVKNQDCVVEAVTGSGKTLAFTIPVLERLSRREEPYKKGEIAAIVVAPTRELATQIHAVFGRFLSSLIPPESEEETADVEGHARPIASSSRSPSPLSDKPLFPLPMLVTSGTPTPYETFQSTHPSILIGTPGRLAAFLLNPRGLAIVRVSELDVLVLDEADRLLSSPDHRRDVERIMRHLPKQRRTHLFSATMTDAVEEMIGLGLRNPVRIVVNLKDKRKDGEEPKERRTPMALQNTYLVCRHAEKTLQLIRLLLSESTKHERSKFIVYFSTCAAVDYFYRILSRLPLLSKFHLTSFHGELPPKIRETALSTFTSHPSSHLSPAVLLCTDVAARGVDFPDIDVVVQYDAPTDPKTFSHRAGRTARAGRRGKAVLLLGKGREEDYVDFLNIRKIPLTKQPYISASLEEVDTPQILDPEATTLLHSIRQIILTDRELSDKAAKSFVSSFRAYSKHEASFIFRTLDFDFNSQAISFGLLRLPAMPEIKDWKKKKEAERQRLEKIKSEGGEVEEREVIEWEDAEVNWDTFAYASKQREASRLATLAQRAESHSSNDAARAEARAKRKIKAEMREAWSEQKERKVRKEERREKKDAKKKYEWELEQANGEGDRQSNLADIAKAQAERKKKREREEESWDEEMGKEYKSLKQEIKEEKSVRKSSKGGMGGGGIGGGMFDDLE